MKETEFNTWLEEAKTALDTFSAGQEELTRLYEEAKANAKAEYDAQKEQLKKDTQASKNQAVTDTMKTERDLDRTLASRGLAFSGENAQTGLDLTLDLRGRLAELDDNESRRAGELEAHHNDTQNQLSMTYNKQRTEGAEKMADLLMDMANASMKYSDSDATTEPQPETESAVTSENPYGIPMPDFTGMSFSQRVKAMAEYTKKVNAAKELAEKFTPVVSAKELAKQLVSVAGEGGVISTIAQQESLEKILGGLLEAHDLSDGYLEELMLNLRSLGYLPNYREDVSYGMEDLIKRSADARDDYYSRYYRIYRSAGYSPEESDAKAGETALFLQFVYLYRNSRTKEMFETAMGELGYRKELNSFYAEIAKKPDEYALGSSLDK